MIVHIFQYPVILLLRNHIYKAKKALDLSKFDQHNLKLKTDEWVTSEPDSMFHFRPYVQSPNPSETETETETETEEA